MSRKIEPILYFYPKILFSSSLNGLVFDFVSTVDIIFELNPKANFLQQLQKEYSKYTQWYENFVKSQPNDIEADGHLYISAHKFIEFLNLINSVKSNELTQWLCNLYVNNTLLRKNTYPLVQSFFDGSPQAMKYNIRKLYEYQVHYENDSKYNTTLLEGILWYTITIIVNKSTKKYKTEIGEKEYMSQLKSEKKPKFTPVKAPPIPTLYDDLSKEEKLEIFYKKLNKTRHWSKTMNIKMSIDNFMINKINQMNIQSDDFEKKTIAKKKYNRS
ncbi:MAG: hypothetical protein NW207_09755 [Cytophagales bacterium]|nr:hypothetical protein [Cytophagales bacterium]